MENEKKLSEVEKAQQRQALYDQFVAEIESRQPFADELTKYADGEKEYLYQHIAKEKRYYTEYGEYWYQQKQEAESKWVDEAFERLKEIQQKKLFDVQCLWKAEQVTLPQIEATIDFRKCGNDVLNCPFIDPITQDEVDVYAAYLQSNNFQFHLAFLQDWQDLELLVLFNGGELSDYLPVWYHFHNSRTGKGALLSLPNIRGEKENFYRTLAAKTNNEKAAEINSANSNNTQPVQPPIVNKPHLSVHDTKVLDVFVSSFEDKETQSMYKKYKRMTGFVEKRDYQYDEMWETLALHNEVWPIKAHHDWREAFNNCYRSYQQHKIAEALPLAYEQYKMYLEMAIPFEPDEQYSELSNSFAATTKAQILEGRKLNGEPENFDF